jgi:hypothetical protein
LGERSQRESHCAGGETRQGVERGRENLLSGWAAWRDKGSMESQRVAKVSQRRRKFFTPKVWKQDWICCKMSMRYTCRMLMQWSSGLTSGEERKGEERRGRTLTSLVEDFQHSKPPQRWSRGQRILRPEAWEEAIAWCLGGRR